MPGLSEVQRQKVRDGTLFGTDVERPPPPSQSTRLNLLADTLPDMPTDVLLMVTEAWTGKEVVISVEKIAWMNPRFPSPPTEIIIGPRREHVLNEGASWPEFISKVAAAPEPYDEQKFQLNTLPCAVWKDTLTLEQAALRKLCVLATIDAPNPPPFCGGPNDYNVICRVLTHQTVTQEAHGHLLQVFCYEERTKKRVRYC